MLHPSTANLSTTTPSRPIDGQGKLRKINFPTPEEMVEIKRREGMRPEELAAEAAEAKRKMRCGSFGGGFGGLASAARSPFFLRLGEQN